MKKIIVLALLLSSTLATFGQKKDKIKGTKVVTIEKHNTEYFNQIEIEDNIEVTLIKADKNSIEVETDENLHLAIDKKVYGSILRLNTNKTITSFKKLEIRVFYTDSLKQIIAKNEAIVNAVQELATPAIKIIANDYAKLLLNVNCPTFGLVATDKSKTELNLKSQDATIEVSKNANLKALLSVNKLHFDMYQKSTATIEGEAIDLKIRLDNNAKYMGKNMTAKTLNINTEAYTTASIHTNGLLFLSVSGKSEISIYGEPKIDIRKFTDDAILYKKSK